MRPLASVIIPAHNTAPWVETAVRSVLSQSFPGLELIVVDDGSTDGTHDVLRGISDPRLRILRQEHLGSSAARNAGIAVSEGKYTGILDSDDAWLPSKLERHIAVLDSHPEVDLTFSWSAIIDEAGIETGHTQTAAAGVTEFRNILAQDVIGNGSCVVARRQALEDAGLFDTNLRASTDHDMLLRVALLRPANAWCIPEVLTLYRRREGQATKNWRATQAETEKVMRKMNGLVPGLPRGLWRDAQATNLRCYAFMAYESGEPGVAGRLLARGAQCAPVALLADRRTWSLAAAIAARVLLPSKLFQKLRALRASTKRLSSGRLSSSCTSGNSPV